MEESGGCLVPEEVGTVWGHEGLPRRRRGETENQNHFRWFQVRLIMCTVHYGKPV